MIARLALALALVPGAVLAPRAALADPVPPAEAVPAAASPAAPAPIRPVPPPAATRPASFELIDRGDAVEVIARNIKAARTAVLPLRSRLQVPITGAPSVKRVVPVDSTVKLIELDSEDATRVLSVKLSFDYPDTKAVSRFAQAMQVGDDLHVLIPRKLPAEGTAARLPEPTLPPAIAAAVAQLEQLDATLPMLGPKRDASSTRQPDAKIDAKPDAKIDTKPDAKIDVKPEAKQDTKIDAKPGAKPGAKTDVKIADVKIDARPDAAEPRRDAAADAGNAAKQEPTREPTSDPRTDETAATARPDGAKAGKPHDGRPLNQSLAGEPDDTWSKISTYGALGLAAAGVGLWLMRRRRAQVAPAATIEVIAQRSLGGKARIVWLSAGPREMIVSVTPQQVRVLGQWRKSEAALPVAHARSDERPRAETVDDRSTAVPAESFASGTGDVPRPVSPAVTGILRLRGRTGQMAAVSEDIAGDVVADELWAKEILAATEARPGARR